MINTVAQTAVNDMRVIQRGVGKGLQFNAQNAHPGYVLGTSSPRKQSFFADVLSEGDVFYDVGAHVGFFSVLAGRLVGPSGQVVAFEPSPEDAERIRENAAANNFEHIEVVEAAVCNSNGSVSFEADQYEVGSSIKPNSNAPTITVEAITLDKWIENATPPDVIKMDIEGAEIDALRGGKDLLRKHRPIILVEVHWKGKEFRNFADEVLSLHGYVTVQLSGESLPRRKRYRYQALIVPDEEAGRIDMLTR